MSLLAGLAMRSRQRTHRRNRIVIVRVILAPDRRAPLWYGRTPGNPTMRQFLAVIALAYSLRLGAATFTVTTTADSGAGSLRQAMLDASVNPGVDTVNFAIGSGPQTITV